MLVVVCKKEDSWRVGGFWWLSVNRGWLGGWWLSVKREVVEGWWVLVVFCKKRMAKGLLGVGGCL